MVRAFSRCLGISSLTSFKHWIIPHQWEEHSSSSVRWSTSANCTVLIHREQRISPVTPNDGYYGNICYCFFSLHLPSPLSRHECMITTVPFTIIMILFSGASCLFCSDLTYYLLHAKFLVIDWESPPCIDVQHHVFSSVFPFTDHIELYFDLMPPLCGLTRLRSSTTKWSLFP